MDKTQDNIIKALQFLHPDMGAPGEGVVELMATGANGTNKLLWSSFCGGKNGVIAGWFDNRKKILSTATDLDLGWNDRGEARYPESVYVTLNPVHDALLGRSNNRMKGGAARSTDKDVLHYRNILIDIDAKTPAGTSSSAPEHAAAHALAQEIREWTRNTLFWPDPMYCNSGNGAHLVFKAYVENNKENTALLKEFLTLLGQKFNTTAGVAIEVDTSVFNPARLTKMYGTWVRKGDVTATRPHRQSCVIEAPASGAKTAVITTDLLKAAVDLLGDKIACADQDAYVSPHKSAAQQAPRKYPASLQPADMFKSVSGIEPVRTGGKLKVDEYLKDNNIALKEIKEGPGDSTLYVLETCIFDTSHSGGEAAIGQNVDGKLWYHCFHDTCSGDPERNWAAARKIISETSGLGKWMEGGVSGIEFPHVNKDGKPLARLDNFRVLCAGYGVQLRYNSMTRQPEYKLPDALWSTSDRLANLALDVLEEWCCQHGLPATRLQGFVRMLSEERSYHPVCEWIESAAWDGTSHLEDLAATIKVPDGQNEQWRVYIKKWLVQAIAALYQPDFSARGVLTFTGNQGVGKTQWFSRLVPTSLDAFGEGMHLDPSNKDSLLEVLSCWIVELGELDATFKKADISKIKAFLTKKLDKVRPPYGRSVETWRRQTSFGATVNDPEFLVDATGNTRWWVIATEHINWQHDINTQQLWAEAKVLFDAGQTWFLDDFETRKLDQINKQYEIADPVEEGLHKSFKFDTLQASWVNWMTTTDILDVIGIPTNNRGQVTKCGIVLKKLVGPAKHTKKDGVQGRYYCMPPRRDLYAEPEQQVKHKEVTHFKDITKI